MKLVYTILVSAILLLNYSCQDKGIVTESGTKINILSSSEGRALVDSTVLLIKMVYARENGEVLWSTPGNRTVAIPVYKRQWVESGAMYEAFTYLREGDSATFNVRADDLYEKSLNTVVPDTIQPDENMLIGVKFDSMMTTLEFRRMKEKEIHSRYQEELKNNNKKGEIAQ